MLPSSQVNPYLSLICPFPVPLLRPSQGTAHLLPISRQLPILDVLYTRYLTSLCLLLLVPFHFVSIIFKADTFCSMCQYLIPFYQIIYSPSPATSSTEISCLLLQRQTDFPLSSRYKAHLRSHGSASEFWFEQQSLHLPCCLHPVQCPWELSFHRAFSAALFWIPPRNHFICFVLSCPLALKISDTYILAMKYSDHPEIFWKAEAETSDTRVFTQFFCFTTVSQEILMWGA